MGKKVKKKRVNCEFVKCVWFAWKALLLVFNRLKCSSYLHPALQHTHLKRTTTLQFHDVYNHVHDLIFSCTMHSNPFGYWFAWSKTGYAFQTKSEDVTVASWNNLFLHIPVLLSSKPKPSSKEACLHWWTTTTGVNVSFMGWRRGSTFFSFFLCFIIMVRPPSDDEWATFRKIIFFSALATWAWVCACMGGGGGAAWTTPELKSSGWPGRHWHIYAWDNDIRLYLLLYYILTYMQSSLHSLVVATSNPTD